MQQHHFFVCGFYLYSCLLFENSYTFAFAWAACERVGVCIRVRECQPNPRYVSYMSQRNQPATEIATKIIYRSIVRRIDRLSWPRGRRLCVVRIDRSLHIIGARIRVCRVVRWPRACCLYTKREQ